MTPRQRTAGFCARFGLRVPILQAPMAGASPPGLAAAVANAGGLGGYGALLHDAAGIAAWSAAFRAASNGAVQINLWVPDPDPPRDPAREAATLAALAAWGPAPPPLGEGPWIQDFNAQCEALLAAAPPIVSSIMGLFPAPFVERLKARGIAWFACVTTPAEARAAEAAGADAVVAQGAEAGGHRGTFEAARAEAQSLGLFVLLPQVADAVRLPVIATGGIMDGRGAAAALALGASAVQLGTAFLRCPEAAIAPAWAERIGRAAPEELVLTRAFSGRLGRGIANDYVRGAPEPLPYPLQRVATGPMREEAAKAGDPERMQMWAGQGAALARAEPAAEVVRRVWSEAEAILA
ncbi:MAG TPA: nitronate monooxygenase [Falsiroseomonas sp.]|jgi:nitronate monooxygenase|nr:nitronate monooxygenase [Falsiroseomonas sp.]